MKANIQDRIKDLRESLKLSQSNFGHHLGLSFATISGYERTAPVPLSSIKSICNYYHVREDWLVNGEGEMFEPVKDADEVAIIIERYKLSNTAASILKGFLSMSEQDRNTLADLVHTMAHATVQEEPGSDSLKPQKKRTDESGSKDFRKIG